MYFLVNPNLGTLQWYFREGVGYVKTRLSVSYFIMLTTTCFGNCGPYSGHKIYIEENYTDYVLCIFFRKLYKVFFYLSK